MSKSKVSDYSKNYNEDFEEFLNEVIYAHYSASLTSHYSSDSRTQSISTNDTEDEEVLSSRSPKPWWASESIDGFILAS